MNYQTCRRGYRTSYNRSRRGPAYRARQGIEGFIAGLALAIIIAIAI